MIKKDYLKPYCQTESRVIKIRRREYSIFIISMVLVIVTLVMFVIGTLHD